MHNTGMVLACEVSSLVERRACLPYWKVSQSFMATAMLQHSISERSLEADNVCSIVFWVFLTKEICINPGIGDLKFLLRLILNTSNTASMQQKWHESSF